MAGYTRQSSAEIAAGEDVLAAPLNAEFNALQAAFHATTGHTHDGSSANGPKISLTGAVSGILPWANGGTGGTTVDNTVPRFNGTTGIIQTSGVVISDTNAVSGIVGLTVTGGGSLTGTWTNLGTVTTIDLNGGTIDGTVIGGSSPAAGSFTTLTLTNDLSVANGGTGTSSLTSGNVLVGAGTDAVTTTKAAPTGDFVGTSDTQTLTNKSIVATQLTGTVASDRISGSYTGITGTGALNAGSITSGFGSIDIGTDEIIAGNLTLSGSALTFSNNQFDIRADTSDASDTKVVVITGGGSPTTTRGGIILAYGNEHASQPGRVRILSSTSIELSATDTSVSGTLSVSGATTLAALSATTGTFSNAVSMLGLTATTGNFSSSVTGLGFGSDNGVFAYEDGGTILLRPNGRGDGTNQVTITTAGAVSMQALSATTGTFSSTVSMTGLTATTGAFSSTVTLTSTDPGASAGPTLTLYRNSASPAANDDIGSILFQGEDSAGNTQTYAEIRGGIDAATSGSEEGSIQFWAVNSGSLTRVMNVSDGVSISPNVGGILNVANAEYGVSFSYDNAGETTISCTGTAPLRVKRGEDGTLVNWYSGTTNEGSVSVSAGTVTYGAFCGVHWSQWAKTKPETILRGTLIETVDEMCEWEGESNHTLPKSKISDTVASKNIYGVFSHYDLDDDFEDFNVASLGAYVIRVASGVTVQRGDYLESNGDGCARIQSDDVLRSSTVAKVTSTTVIETYPDGSYLVPCTLHCG